MISDVLSVIINRIDPTLIPVVQPVIESVREEYGGREHYIYSARRQRQKNICADLQQQSTAVVAQRYRVTQRTAKRLKRHLL